MSSDIVRDVDVDIEALREKYRRERDKRIRPDGTDQFRFAEGELSKFDDDPYAGPPPAREPIITDLDLLIVGAGFGGMITSVAALDQGIDDFRIIDVAGDFGGTWYWNRYPGIRCDIESYTYLPLLERTGYMPSERYVRGDEILAYSKQIAEQFELYEHAVLQTRVTGMTWDEDRGRWIVTTDRGDRFAARFVTTQSGTFVRPQLPSISGIETFAGTAFHTARWDYAYTGGDSRGGLDGLSDKRVAVFGTGATGLQVIPEVAKSARHLIVLQRTPTAVNERSNGPTDPEWFTSLPPGWQRERMDSFNKLANFEPADCGIDDAWIEFFSSQVEAVAQLPEADRTDPEKVNAVQEAADFAFNERLRRRVDATVRSPEKAELLKAYYRTLCKRPGFSDDYLPAFDQDNVDLVDVSGCTLRIRPEGVEIDGVLHEVDCLIFATGFALGTTWTHQAQYDVVGRDGARLSNKWAAGVRTYHGLFSRGFPNLCFMGLTQTGVTFNYPHMIQEQAAHATWVMRQAIDRGVDFEATEEAEAAWQEAIAAVNAGRRPFQEACTPGYFNAEGRPEDRRSNIASALYFPSTEFFDMWAQWRASGDFEGLELTPAVAVANARGSN